MRDATAGERYKSSRKVDYHCARVYIEVFSMWRNFRVTQTTQTTQTTTTTLESGDSYIIYAPLSENSGAAGLCARRDEWGEAVCACVVEV